MNIVYIVIITFKKPNRPCNAGIFERLEQGHAKDRKIKEVSQSFFYESYFN